MASLRLFPVVLCASFLAAPHVFATTQAAKRANAVASTDRVEAAPKSKSRPKPRKTARAKTPPGSTGGAKTRARANTEAKSNTGTRASSASRGATTVRSLPPLIDHRVKRGETLSALAVRYDTTVGALKAINGLEKVHSIREGQVLRVPSPADARLASWHPYVKPSKQPGYIEIVTHTSRFSGLAVDAQGRLRPAAVRAINGLLGAGGSRPPLPERLIRILIGVSDTFGRPLRVVSGYRTASYYQDSKHKRSAAVDFSVVGVPNAVLCDYLRGLENVGVGYYPNSTFVHVDVRGYSAYWVDYSGPGEPPRRSPTAPATPPRDEKRKLLAELDSVFSEAMTSLERARTSKRTSSRSP